MENIQIAVRVRPKLAHELRLNCHNKWIVNKKTITRVGLEKSYTFDHIFDADANNSHVFNTAVRPMIAANMQGYNATVLTYGQTSSGKTHTMLGSQTDPGLIKATIDSIFENISNVPRRKFLLRLAYVQIYNDCVYDLLGDISKTINIHDDPGDMRMDVSEVVIRTAEEAHRILAKGERQRKYASVKANIRSSRAHTILKIMVESTWVDDTHDPDVPVQVSHLHLVELAGSDRILQTNGQKLQDGSCKNKSLLTLSMVIEELNKGRYMASYRNSNLTKILKDSLGGNSKTLIVATINPTSVEETNSTLLFLRQAKKIKNKPVINETVNSKTKKYIEMKKNFWQKIEKMLENNEESETQNIETINNLSGKINKLEQQFVTSSTILQVRKKPQHTGEFTATQFRCKALLEMLTRDLTHKTSQKQTDVFNKIVENNIDCSNELEMLCQEFEHCTLSENSHFKPEDQHMEIIMKGVNELYNTLYNKQNESCHFCMTSNHSIDSGCEMEDLSQNNTESHQNLDCPHASSTENTTGNELLNSANSSDLPCQKMIELLKEGLSNALGNIETMKNTETKLKTILSEAITMNLSTYNKFMSFVPAINNLEAMHVNVLSKNKLLTHLLENLNNSPMKLDNNVRKLESNQIPESDFNTRIITTNHTRLKRKGEDEYTAADMRDKDCGSPYDEPVSKHLNCSLDSKADEEECVLNIRKSLMHLEKVLSSNNINDIPQAEHIGGAPQITVNGNTESSNDMSEAHSHGDDLPQAEVLRKLNEEVLAQRLIIQNVMKEIDNLKNIMCYFERKNPDVKFQL